MVQSRRTARTGGRGRWDGAETPARGSCPAWQWPRCWRREAPPPHRKRERPSVNLYGVPGVIDMPGAIVQPDGQMTASYAAFGNTTRRNFSFQILPRVIGSAALREHQQLGRRRPGLDLFDRSFDLHIQLLNEQPGWQPSLMLGFRDILGTGVYSAEYLVASKTVCARLHAHGRRGLGPAGRGEYRREPVLRRRGYDVRSRRRYRRGRQARVGPLFPRRGHGVLRRRRVADADREADAEGRGLVRRLHARAARPGAPASTASRRSTSGPSIASAPASLSAATICTATPSG